MSSNPNKFCSSGKFIKSNLCLQLTEKEAEVLKLNRDITDLHRSLASKEEECLASTQSVQRAQHNEATANSHSQKLESMINDLRAEITDAKALHRQAVYDSQHCERRVKLLEEELNCAREEAAKGVEEIGMLQNRLKEATNATHNHKDLLKSEVRPINSTLHFEIRGSTFFYSIESLI